MKCIIPWSELRVLGLFLPPHPLTQAEITNCEWSQMCRAQPPGAPCRLKNPECQLQEAGPAAGPHKPGTPHSPGLLVPVVLLPSNHCVWARTLFLWFGSNEVLWFDFHEVLWFDFREVLWFDCNQVLIALMLGYCHREMGIDTHRYDILYTVIYPPSTI